MLSKAHRLTSREVISLKKTGKTRRLEGWILIYDINKNTQLPKFAVVVSNNVSKSAVTRNKIKRIVFDHLQTNLTLIKNPYSILVIVSTSSKSFLQNPKLDILDRILNSEKII